MDEKRVPVEKAEDDFLHTITLASMAATFFEGDRDITQKVDMAVVHEWPESPVYEGKDYLPGQIAATEKRVIEEAAMRRITEDLSRFSDYAFRLWEEYADERSARSRLMHQLNTIANLPHARIYNRQGYPTDDFFTNAREKLEEPRLLKLVDVLERDVSPDPYITMYEMMKN